ncbi:MAG: Rrf2 family transcriptional regulator [Treponemataceae bacterium]|nr:Rrf2 family transcriptional regulator [Treponemataceae bacterium]
MLKISTRSQYALLIMTDLAQSDPGKYIPLKNLSQKHNLSVKYLEQILIQLGKAGLVSGLRGNNGGYKITKSPEEYSAGEIIRTMEGNLSPCDNIDENFSDAGNIQFWDGFAKSINDYVDSISLDMIVQKNQDEEGLDYCI